MSDQAGQAAGEGGELPPGAGAGEQPPVPGAVAGDVLVPAIEEMALQCAQYIVKDPEDVSLYVVGSEQGADKNAFAERDMLYLNRGSNAGVKAGDAYTIQHASYEVKHPDSGRTIGRKVETTGWGRVILVEENSAILMVEGACQDIHLGDYVKPMVKVSVPLIMRRAPADRLRVRQPPRPLLADARPKAADQSLGITGTPCA